MKLTKQQVRTIIEGSTILGTGGGGRFDSALNVIKKLPSVDLINYDELADDDIVITAYGAGGLTKPKSTSAAMAGGLKLLQSRLGKQIKAIVPVEIGPYSLAVSFEIATTLDIPVIDGDLVGYRSVPEIFIELVTLADLSRCPLVFGNNEGDLVLLDETSNPECLEQIVRNFASNSLSNTFVLGYPYTKRQLESCLAAGSVSYCLGVRNNLSSEFTLAGWGRVISDEKQEVDGFTKGYMVIKGPNTKYRVEFKNEYLVLQENKKLLVTCPDFICVVDRRTKLGLNNGDDNLNKEVEIYIRPAISQWRTKQGLALFTPNKLGLSYKQKIME